MATITLTGKTQHGRERQVITAFPDMAVAITPHATDVLYEPVTVYCGTSGNVVCYPENDSTTAVTVAVQAGGYVPFRTRRVLAAGTTATGLIGLY